MTPYFVLFGFFAFLAAAIQRMFGRVRETAQKARPIKTMIPNLIIWVRRRSSIILDRSALLAL